MAKARGLIALVAAVLMSVAVPAGSAYASALPANVREFMHSYRQWGAAPTVEAYMNLFTPDATLMDSGLAAPIDGPKIRAQIVGVLEVVPDYRFDPFTATASPDGKVVFVQARNTGTVQGKPVSFTTMHRLVLEGAQVRQGRRFWDQTELFRPVAPDLPNLFAGLGESASTAEEKPRQRAWNSERPAALIVGTGLTGPGLSTPLSSRAAKAAYLRRLFGAVDLDLRAGHAVRQNGIAYLEWIGTASVAGDHPRTVQFGIVERLNRDGEWTLAFDTLDVVASPERIAQLRALIFGR